jgi:hypothetical protein
MITVPVVSHARRALALCALVALPLLAGCGSPSGVLARVGRHTITIGDFVDVARGNEARYAGLPDSAKAMLLQDLLRRALLLAEAERRGLYRDSLVKNFSKATADDILLNALFASLSPRNIAVSDGEIEQLYAWRDTVGHVLLIYAPSRSAAGGAIGDLRHGAPFAMVADRYGMMGVLPPGGDLGFLAPGSLVPPLDRYLRTAALNQVIGPIEAPGEGWFIMEVLARRAQPQPPLDGQQRFVLGDMLRQRKQRVLAVRAVTDLRAGYAMRLEPGAGQALFAHLNGPGGPLTQGMGETLPARPLPEELGIVLGRWEDGPRAGTYTMAEAIADLNVAGREHPSPTVLPSIQHWIETQMVRRIAAIEARHRHLDEDPAIARGIEQRIDNYVLNSFYDAELAPRAEITPDDVRAAYDRNPGAFQRLDQVRLLETTLADSAKAAALLVHAGHAPSLREAVAMAAPGARVTEETVRFPAAPGPWKPHAEALMGMAPKECIGPIAVKGGWLIAQLVSKVQGPQPFESLPEEVMQYLRQQAADTKRDRVLNETVSAISKTVKPEVYPERLKNIPWPLPPAPGANSQPG